ncbi:hypothetical protein B0F90DRAFT_401937 [Multifurca ochricompacta]|uniref:Uncharacterized protein n=1 Tax=Multifurca ochricompacta TaxID=376703 RepID=A0AAD4QNF9_9AGAM|nr:hypothetical protein B0F90DRAFT_401937 [Multifurca ochricompacta]
MGSGAGPGGAAAGVHRPGARGARNEGDGAGYRGARKRRVTYLSFQGGYLVSNEGQLVHLDLQDVRGCRGGERWGPAIRWDRGGEGVDEGGIGLRLREVRELRRATLEEGVRISHLNLGLVDGCTNAKVGRVQGDAVDLKEAGAPLEDRRWGRGARTGCCQRRGTRMRGGGGGVAQCTQGCPRGLQLLARSVLKVSEGLGGKTYPQSSIDLLACTLEVFLAVQDMPCDEVPRDLTSNGLAGFLK